LVIITTLHHGDWCAKRSSGVQQLCLVALHQFMPHGT
jgi:hypothetical protein